MSLCLKLLKPIVEILGKRQRFDFNEESETSENIAELFLTNHFAASSTTSLYTSLNFLNKDFKGYRFLHDSDNTGYGNFTLQKHSVLPYITDNIFNYNESSDELTFYKKVNFTGGGAGGSVSSVGLVVSDGLNVTGSPITDSGTFNLSLSSNLQELNKISDVGFVVRTMDGSYENRILIVGSNLTISNASGNIGNPTLDIAEDIILKTLVLDDLNAKNILVSGGDVQVATGSIIATVGDVVVNSGNVFVGTGEVITPNLISPTADPINVKSSLNLSSKTIGNLANGLVIGDAVNLGQLNTSNTTTLNSAKSYTDTGDTTTLASAKAYTDSAATSSSDSGKAYTDAAVASTLTSANTYTDNNATATLNSAKIYADTGDATTLASATTYTDNTATTTLNLGKAYTDSTATTTLNSSKSYADTGDANTLASANTYTNNKTWAASQISNFDTQVRTSRLDQMAKPTANLDANNNIIQNVANGTQTTDAVNLGQLDVVRNRTLWYNQSGGNAVTMTAGISITGFTTNTGAFAFYAYNAAQGKEFTGVSSTGGLDRYSLSCSDRVRATEFNAYSSIEKKIIISDNRAKVEQESLALLKQIPIVKYEYKDKIKEGSGISYGVIAEQLNEVIPDYVDMESYDFVPNIMSAGNATKLKAGEYKITLSKKIKVNEKSKRLRLITLEKGVDVEITSVKNNVICVTSEEPIKKEVFVYGTYERCPTVAKQKMFELSIAVIQNLASRVEQLEKQLKDR